MSEAEHGGAGRRLSRPVLLQAAVTLVAVAALRASGPLLGHVADVHGVPTAALVALLVYAAPVLTAPAVRWLGAGRATVGAVVLLVLLRLVAQFQHTPGLGVAAAGAVVALGALVLVTDQVVTDQVAADRVARPVGVPDGGGVRAAAGVVLGGAVDVAVRTAFGTWDPVWRSGLLPWLYTGFVCLALLVLLARAHSGFTAAVPPRQTRRLAVLGPYLALYVLVLGSPAFVASQSGTGLPYTAVALLAGAVLSIEAVSRLPLPGGSGRLPVLPGRLGGGVAALLLVAAVLVALFGHGPVVVPAVLVGQVAVAVLLARAFTGREASGAASVPDRPVDEPPRPRPRPGGRPPVTVGADRLRARPARPGVPPPVGPWAGHLPAGLGTGLGFVLVVLLYQATYELPLPFDNRLLPVAAAVLLGLAGMGRRLPGLRVAGRARGERLGDPFHEHRSERQRVRSGVVPESAPGGMGRRRVHEHRSERQRVRSGVVPESAPGGMGRRDEVTDRGDGAVAAAGDGRRARRGPLAPLAGIPAVLLLVPALLLATSPAPAAAGRSTDVLRLVTWNLHYGVGDDAAVDLGAVARVLRAQHPDVVLVQEVNRGWPVGGGTDMAEWLSRALAMPYVWSPAADGQFGNMILSSLPMSEVRTGPLPYGAGPQRRSYASARLELPSGRTLTVLTAHLQDHTDNRPTRLAEIDALLRHWHRASPAVIAGDFNAMPGWPGIDRMQAAGLVSAQDSVGRGGLLTSPTDHPRYRPDWIFGTPDVSFTGFAMPHSRASDHFPLAVTVRLG